MQDARFVRAAVPCQYSNKGNGRGRFPANHVKAMVALFANMEWLFQTFGVERLLLVTLTFKTDLSREEVSRRFKSLRTGVLKNYKPWLWVAGAGKNGRVHYHVLTHAKADVRMGFDFARRRKRQNHSANEALRREWRFWLKIAERYGFGRVEAMPVENRIGLNNYLCEHVLFRDLALSGKKVVNYSRGWKPHSCKFSFAFGNAQEFRAQAAKFFAPLSFEEVCRRFGRDWPRLVMEHLDTLRSRM